ncbi:RNase P subunit p30 family protein [archaeon]
MYYDLFASKKAEGFSPAKPVKFKKGGSEEDNKKIARSRTQVLLDPLDSGKMTIDTATLQVAKDNDIAVAITFRQFLVAGKFKRIRLIVAYRKLIQICLKKKNRVILSTGAENDHELRSPEQLIAFGVFLGLTRQQAKWAISKAPEYVMEATK